MRRHIGVMILTLGLAVFFGRSAKADGRFLAQLSRVPGVRALIPVQNDTAKAAIKEALRKLPPDKTLDGRGFHPESKLKIKLSLPVGRSSPFHRFVATIKSPHGGRAVFRGRVKVDGSEGLIWPEPESDQYILIHFSSGELNYIPWLPVSD